MDAFFGITLSLIVLFIWFRSATRKPDPRELRRNTVKARWDRKKIRAQKIRQEARLAQKAQNKRQKLTDDEIVSVILPTINNDK